MTKVAITVRPILFIVALCLSDYAVAERVSIGAFQSKAIWTKNTETTAPSPVLILLPGSGEFGPEEMVPKESPPKGSDGYAELSLFAQSFRHRGFHTLQLGKPGVDYFSNWETFVAKKNFYDKPLWDQLHWDDLIKNVEAALEFVKTDPFVDTSRIYLLGHSEGTILASDVAAIHPEIAGVVLLGYAGENIASTVYWQMVDRQMEMVIAPDIDANHDGFVDESEAKGWPAGALFPPQFLKDHGAWDWTAHPRISLSAIADMWKNDPQLQAQTDMTQWKVRFPFWRELVSRSDVKQKTASIRGSVHVFTGEMDVNTPPKWSFDLKAVCEHTGKSCDIEIVPGLSHLFMPLNANPVGPKQNRLLDQGLNPVSQVFLNRLENCAAILANEKGQRLMGATAPQSR